MKRSEKRWVIVGNCGLYVGQKMTRADIIAEHVSHFAGCNGYPEKISEFTFNGLSETQRVAWKMRKRAGDRAVRVTIRW